MVRRSIVRKKSDKFLSDQQGVSEIIYNLLLFLAVALPLVAFPFVFEDVFDLPKVSLLRIIAFSIAGLWLISAIHQKKIEWNKTPLNIPVIMFIGAVILSTIFSFNIVVSLVGISFKRHEAFPTWLTYFILFFAGSNFLGKPRRLQNFIRVVLITSIAISIYGIFQHFGYDLFSYKVADIDRFRSFATFGNAVFLGGYLVLVIPLAFSLALWEKDVRFKILWLVSGSFALTALVFTYTRGAWIGGVVGLALCLYLVLFKKNFFKSERKKWVLFLVLSLFLILLLVTMTEKIFPVDISVGERVVSAFKLKGSVASRLSIWKSTIHQISARPWLGWGPETQRLVSPLFREDFFVKLEGANKIPDRPHNQLLNVAYSFGLLGVFSYIWLIVVFIWISFFHLRHTKDRDYLISVGVLSGALGYIIQEQFAFSIVGVTPFFWLLMGANLSFLSANKYSRSHIFKAASWLRNLLVGIVFLLFLVGLFFVARFIVADFYYYKGIKSSRRGSTQEAIGYFGQAVVYNPWDAKYIFAYGEGVKNIAVRTNNLFRVEKSISSYRRALEHSPVDYDLLFGLGNAYYVKAFLEGQNNYTQAKAAYAKAIKYEPYFAEAYAWLGKSYLAEGKLEPALENLHKAIELSPRNIAALDALGKAYEKKGDTAKAITCFQKILNVDPYYQPAIRNLKRLKGVSTR